MATRRTGRSVKKRPATGARGRAATRLVRCQIRMGPQRQYSPSVSGERVRLIRMNAAKWLNGTVLHYAFFEDQGVFRKWAGTSQLAEQVRRAFRKWSDLGIGLRFEEVADRDDAEVRIGFEEDDGHWSYIGREVRSQGRDDRTMNLDPSDGIASGSYGVDVACHEIGHTLGFPHEHQNPHAGIVWNEEAVYASLAKPPNRWSRQKTFDNIIDKIQADDVQGSSWDPDSIMHYPFEAGLIREPERYRNGLTPAGGLSARDKEWVRSFYPPLQASQETELPLLETRRLTIPRGGQRNFVLRPRATRYYEIRTFGASDTVVALYHRESNGKDAYLTADDDTGEDRNAYIRRRLQRGRTYLIRIRLYYASDAGETAVMWW